MAGKTFLTCCLMANLMAAGTAFGLPNPAAVYCLEMGYSIDGEDCVFPDGESCEQWAFFFGDCGSEYVHPVPCAEAGEHRGVAVECCDSLTEVPHAQVLGQMCVELFGFPLCSACGDELCDPWENICNCPEDCGDCTAEGEAIPVVPDAPPCCPGLELIPPQSPNWHGIVGYCTALCGDGYCDPHVESAYNCPEDCSCVIEGGAIPAVPEAPECCPGFELIPPKSPFWFGIVGYCTALCGDGYCDTALESSYNCPVDCRRVPRHAPRADLDLVGDPTPVVSQPAPDPEPLPGSP